MNQQLTVKQLAERLGVHPQTIIRMTKTGRLPFTQVGERYRYDWAKVQAHIEKEPSGHAKEN